MPIRYYYPADIKLEVINGETVASVDFSLPTLWSEEATRMASRDYMTGWEMARRNYEDSMFRRMQAKGEIAVLFWDAHRVDNYNPNSPRHTICAFDLEPGQIMKWAESQAESNETIAQLIKVMNGESLG